MTTYLQYPKDHASDFITISIHEYKPRTERDDSLQMKQGDVNGPALALIRLPFPDMPNVTSQQKYGQISGALNNVLATGLGEAYDAISDAGGAIDDGMVDSIAARLQAQMSDAGGPVLREVAASVAGKIVGINAPMFQTLASGEISNPNIELLYNGPTLRSYSFNFTLAPKSSEEAQTVYEIVRTLKQHHLPSKNGGMLQVPNIFRVHTFINGQDGKHYQKFFNSALEAIAFKQDASGSHLTLPNGEPVISSLSLVFRELYITTSEDFEDNI